MAAFLVCWIEQECRYSCSSNKPDGHRAPRREFIKIFLSHLDAGFVFSFVITNRACVIDQSKCYVELKTGQMNESVRIGI